MKQSSPGYVSPRASLTRKNWKGLTSLLISPLVKASQKEKQKEEKLTWRSIRLYSLVSKECQLNSKFVVYKILV